MKIYIYPEEVQEDKKTPDRKSVSKLGISRWYISATGRRQER
jgi:hypothetical protein